MSKPKKKISGASLRHAFEEIIWPRKKLVGLGLALILVNRFAGLVLPAASKYLIDRAIPGASEVGTNPLGLSSVPDAQVVLSAVAIAILFQASTSYALTMLLSVEAQHLIAHLRAQVQKHVLQLPVNVFDDNVTLTPHIGWKRVETRQRLIDSVAERIKEFVDGEDILNVVNQYEE